MSCVKLSTNMFLRVVWKYSRLLTPQFLLFFRFICLALFYRTLRLLNYRILFMEIWERSFIALIYEESHDTPPHLI
ncbi:hypothetical protein RJT34_01826 [Clitoria ternatea]|uniref:Uncharacterized protein n=1 Tax=Clitoria ternatea TaxID=43366 RepID=A0AAN9KHG3_CLITE